MPSKRITVIGSELAQAKYIIERLRQDDIPNEQIYLIFKKNDTDPKLDEPMATDLVGTLVGEITLKTLGLIAGLPVLTFTGGILIASGTPLSASELAAGLSAWLADTLDPSFSHEKMVKEYTMAVNEGSILVITEVPPDKVADLIQDLQEIDQSLQVERL